MVYKNNVILTALFTAVLSIPAHAGLVDLSAWSEDGGGNWVLPGAPNHSVFQTLNSPTTMFFNNENSQGKSLSGSIKVEETGGDDDFVGFVLGYDDNDLFGSNATTDYILIDWKQGTQSGWDAGMAISRVTGSINAGGVSTGSNAWQHTGNVNFIERAATLGNTGWSDNVEYLFEISFTATNITVEVNGVEQFNINGTFEDGSFGFYNFSQPRVRYAGIEEDVLPPQCGVPGQPACSVPEPISVGLLSASLAAMALLRKNTLALQK